MIACNSKSRLKRSELLEISAETGLSSKDLNNKIQIFLSSTRRTLQEQACCKTISVWNAPPQTSTCACTLIWHTLIKHSILPGFIQQQTKTPGITMRQPDKEESEWESMKWYLVWVFVLCWLWLELGWLTGTQPHSEFITKVKGQYEGKRGKVRGRRRQRQTGNTL